MTENFQVGFDLRTVYLSTILHPPTSDHEFLDRFDGSNFADLRLRRHAPEFPESAKIGWIESRRCLLAAIQKSGAAHQHLVRSLSHARNASAACVTDAKLCKGVGVDIEPLDRKLSPGLAAKIIGGEEIPSTMDALELWCIKEACFKADGDNDLVTVVNYSVVAFDAHSGRGTAQRKFAKGCSGSFYAFEIKRWKSHVVAVAIEALC